ncbi:membrane protein FAM174B [Hypomesus transpacificus]|uniref:membrane protein FAM174B n=1 Tax=Hypomesus transpacificus TaxID=137520 RepID=UPI001F071CBC|nr:membrane protein FAM174B [Hypomesus transpacificus]
MVAYNLVLSFIIAVVWEVVCEPQTLPSPATHFNSTLSIHEEDLSKNGTNTTTESRKSSILTHLPTLKSTVFLICVLTAVLITCLVIKVCRSGRRIRKTRKYDIITTPAERVEMAPLNEENEDEDDSTLFDVKYNPTSFEEKGASCLPGILHLHGPHMCRLISTHTQVNIKTT